MEMKRDNKKAVIFMSQEWAEKILSGRKDFIFRSSFPEDVDLVFICTKDIVGCGIVKSVENGIVRFKGMWKFSKTIETNFSTREGYVILTGNEKIRIVNNEFIQMWGDVTDEDLLSTFSEEIITIDIE